MKNDEKNDEKKLLNWFTYHAPKPGQVERYGRIREAALAFARVVVAETPPSADQSSAVRKIREAVMTANAAIACHTEGCVRCGGQEFLSGVEWDGPGWKPCRCSTQQKVRHSGPLKRVVHTGPLKRVDPDVVRKAIGCERTDKDTPKRCAFCKVCRRGNLPNFRRCLHCGSESNTGDQPCAR